MNISLHFSLHTHILSFLYYFMSSLCTHTILYSFHLLCVISYTLCLYLSVPLNLLPLQLSLISFYPTSPIPLSSFYLSLLPPHFPSLLSLSPPFFYPPSLLTFFLSFLPPSPLTISTRHELQGPCSMCVTAVGVSACWTLNPAVISPPIQSCDVTSMPDGEELVEADTGVGMGWFPGYLASQGANSEGQAHPRETPKSHSSSFSLFLQHLRLSSCLYLPEATSKSWVNAPP